MDGIGRVESGTETESYAGTLTGRKWLLTSGTSFPAKAEDTELLSFYSVTSVAKFFCFILPEELTYDYQLVRVRTRAW